MTVTRTWIAAAAIAASSAGGAYYYTSPAVPSRAEYQDTANWLDKEVYPGLLGRGLYVDETLDTEGIGAWVGERYTALRLAGNSHEDAKHRLFEEIHLVVFPPPPPDPSARVLAPITGRFGINASGSWSDASGPRLPVILHFGDALLEYSMPSRRGDVLHALDVAADASYSGIRFWSTLRGSWWSSAIGEISPTITPNYWALFDEFIGELRKRKLTAHIAAGDLAWFSRTEREAYHRDMAAALQRAGETVILYEWANEAAFTTGGLTPADAERDVAPIRQANPALVVSLTAWGGTEDSAEHRRWTPAWQQHVQVHAERDGRWWDKIRHLFSLPYEAHVRRRYWHGEPWGVGPRVSASTSGSMAELTADVYGTAAAMTLITGGVWTDFFSPGVILKGEKFETYTQFGVAPKVAAALETVGKEHGTEWGRLRLMHGGQGRPNVWTIRSGVHEPRIDQAIDDARKVVYAVAYSPGAFTATTTWPMTSLTTITPSGARTDGPGTQTYQHPAGGMAVLVAK